MSDITHATGARASRRRAIRHMAAFMAGSPLLSLVDANGEPVQAPEPAGQGQGSGQGSRRQPPAGREPDRPGVIRPPEYSDEIMKVVNLHEFEDHAKKSLSIAAYDYVAAGAGDELTLKANREAFGHYWVRRKVGVDVSKVNQTLSIESESKLDLSISQVKLGTVADKTYACN